jgi:hypothetical protein
MLLEGEPDIEVSAEADNGREVRNRPFSLKSRLEAI